jgi:hypothetical protein
MKSKIKIFLFCPVPENQKPMNEFLSLEQNEYLNWIQFSTKEFQQKLSSFSILIAFLCFVCQLLFSLDDFQQILKNGRGTEIISNLLSFLLQISLNSSLSIFFFLIFIFFRWKLVYDHFQQSRVFYEEGSWYDGQVWEKSLLLIRNDRLLTSQRFQPIFLRFTPIIFLFFLQSILLILFLIH